MVNNIPQYKTPVIYLILCLVNCKIYIGSTKSFAERYRRHRYDYQHKTDTMVLYRAMKKYGFYQFEFFILEDLPNLPDSATMKTLLQKREQYWVDTFRSYDSHIGYNIAKNIAKSMLGVKMSESAKNKVKAARQRQPITHSMLEALRINREAKSKPVLRLDPFTLEILEEYPKISIASKRYGLHQSLIPASIKSSTKSAGFYWVYNKNDINDLRERIQSKNGAGRRYYNRPVRQLDKDGNEIKIWSNTAEIGELLGLNRDRITQCTHIKGAMCGGYCWEYIEDPLLIKQYQKPPRKGYSRSRGEVYRTYYTHVRPIEQLDMDKRVIKIWDRFIDITNALGYSNTQIHNAIRRNGTSNGFRWRFVEDPSIIESIKQRRKQEYDAIISKKRFLDHAE